MEGLGPGSGLLLLARAAWREGKLKFNNKTNLMPSVQQEMKECVHIQDTAQSIYDERLWRKFSLAGSL